MINGLHAIIYSSDTRADLAFFKNVLKLPNVDVGNGRLFFGLPPTELAVHEASHNDMHELYLMCEDIEVFTCEMKKNQVHCSPVQDRGWGLVSGISLPGGGRLGVYQPRHARPPAMKIKRPKTVKKTSKTKSAVGRKSKK